MIGLDNLKASRSFIEGFKAKYKISSRKITVFKTSTEIPTQNEDLERCRIFVEETMAFILQHGIEERKVWNHDQSGFNYEMYGNRTRSNIGKLRIFNPRN